MSQYLVKRQHYVPRTYLKNFACRQTAEDYFVMALPVEKPHQEEIFEINVKNVCLERNLYTLSGDTAEQKMLLERFYSDEIERHYSRIYAILTDPNKTSVSDEERDLIISTVVTTFYRTTKWINQHNDLLKRVYTQMFSLCQQAGRESFLFDGVSISIKGKTLDDLLKEHKIENRPGQVMAQLEVALKLINQRIASDIIYVSKLSDGESEFITSDNPVVLQNINSDYIMPFDPNNIMKLPIDKKHMLFLMPSADSLNRKRIVRNNVDGIYAKAEKLISNTEQFQKADRFIIGDDSSLSSYLGTKELAERPMSDEELKEMTSFDDIIDKGKSLGLL